MLAPRISFPPCFMSDYPCAPPTRGLSRLCPVALLLFLGAHDPFDPVFVLPS